ncbi:nucleotide sugar dehydrogenase [Streptacidiphilus anmyonensis]|uniref:nucleotide sugar dehydrogenase n=1 Tax=Streptacidiphilus anmyonensis TaxID=405782 RepID=UPI0009FCBF6D|nr:nucleotide sugar dehydrogenase [Streptacidiphilus anmyonensis]
MRVVVVGQGYVGLPLAVRAAEVGHEVIGYDVDAGRIKRLAAGESYVEDVAAERLGAVLASGAYRASDAARDCGGFDVAVVTVPTPLREGVPDLSYIEESARTLSRYLRPGATVVLESTTYPGTTQDLFGPLLEDGSGLTAGRDFHLGYSPERIDPGNAVWGFQQTPKVVSGVDPTSLEAVRSFYGQLVDTVVPVSSPKEAELAKLLENTFRHVNIALVNEIAMFARHLEIDVWQAIDAAATKPFGFMRFTPGPGVGGHCLPIDPSYLSWRVQRELGQSFRFVELANDINNHMPEYVTRRLIEAFNERRRSVNGSRVLLLGLAYKKNTGDARESPALRVAQLLLDLGAEVHAADPHVVEPPEVDARLARVELTAEELAAADAVVLLTDHDSFDYALVRAHASYVLDCRRRLMTQDASGEQPDTAAGATVEVL